MLNVHLFIGRVTKEPELKTPSEGQEKAYCFFQLAVENGKGETDFPELVCYNRLAENFCKYVHKGDLICVHAYYRSRFFNQRKYHDFVVYKMEFLEAKRKGDGEVDIPQ